MLRLLGLTRIHTYVEVGQRQVSDTLHSLTKRECKHCNHVSYLETHQLRNIPSTKLAQCAHGRIVMCVWNPLRILLMMLLDEGDFNCLGTS